MKEENQLKRFWNFIKEDTWQSWIVSFILLVVLIRFIFFPFLSFITASELPLVIVESCSMYHTGNFEEWWNSDGNWYESRSITKNDFSSFPLKNGFSKGDIMLVWGRGGTKIGDIIVFKPNENSLAKNPIIHRVVSDNPIGTKGDNGLTNPLQLNGNNELRLDETNISEEMVVGKAVLRLPLLGWVKLIFFEPFRNPSQQGFCS